MSDYTASSLFNLDAHQMTSLLSGLCSAEDQALLKEVFFLKLTNEQWSSVGAIKDAVAYLGFEPKKIIQEFLTKAKSNSKADGNSPITCTSPTGYEKNGAPTDLLFFITLFLERGNNISKILLKCDQEIGSLIRRKASSYGIVMERKQASTVLSTSSLTLARLTQAFPVATAAVILKHKISGKLNTKALVGILELPILLQHTIFLSLIPTDFDEYLRDDLKAEALVLNIDTSILLSSPKDKRKLEAKDVDDLSGQAEQYVSAAMTGSLVTDNAKISILKAASILDVKYF